MNENGNPRVPIQEVDDNLCSPNFTSNLGVIPTSYKDSMDFYETLNWLVKYLEDTIIPAVNEDIEAVEELEKLFEELRAYVDTFSEAIASKQPMITQDNPLASDLVSTANQVNKFVTQAQLILINSIPNKEDVANRVEEITQYSTNTEYPTAKAVYDLSLLKENITNKVTALTSESTDTEYPSAKAVYDQLLLKEDLANKVNMITNASTNTQYPSAKAVYNVSENLNSMINDIYNVLPRVSGTGSTVTLNDTAQTRLDITPKGACEQDSYSGKNLLNASAESYNLSGEGSIRTPIGTVQLVANTKYYISYNIDTTSTSNLRNTPEIALGGTTYVESVTTDYNLTIGRKVWEFTPTTSGNAELRYWLNTNSNAISVSQFMISTSSDTTYEKYVGGIPSPNPSYPQDVRVVTGDNEFVDSNKNILDNIAQSDTYNGIECVVNNDKSITLNGTATANAWIRVTREFTFEANQPYTIFISNVMNNDVSLYHSDIGYVYTYKNVTFTEEKTITNNLNLRIASGGVLNNFIVYPMIVKGTYTDQTIGTYVAHAEQKVTLHNVPNLAGIGDYKDEIVGKTDDWKIVRKVGKKTIDNSITWTQASTYPTVFYCDFSSDYNTTANYLYSKYFKNCGLVTGASDVASKDNNTIGLLKEYYKRLYVNSNYFQNATEIKNFFENADNVYYQLAESAEEPITDTTLITDLNNMYNLMGYDGQTNISFIPSSGNAQGELYVSTLKKIS